MKIILLKDTPKVGKKYDIKNISDGYALNLLIPRGFAEVATDKAVKRVSLEKSKDDVEKKIQEDLLLKNLNDMNGLVIEMSSKASEKGHLFAGIHSAEIAPEITKQTRLIISPDFIKLDKPIKEVGEHEITVQVQDKTVKFKLKITASN